MPEHARARKLKPRWRAQLLRGQLGADFEIGWLLDALKLICARAVDQVPGSLEGGDGSRVVDSARDAPLAEDAMTERPAVTMSYIGELAGVSRTAVSLVLNDRPNRIPREKQDRIRRIAAELGFRPSLLAVELRTGQSTTVAFVSDEIASGSFGGDMVAGVQDAANAAGRVVLLLNTGTEGDLISQPMMALSDRGVSRVLFATVMTRQVELPDLSWANRVVLLNCLDPEDRYPSILPDDYSGGRAAAAHLVELGHSRIAYLGGDPDTIPIRDRVLGVRNALAENGLSLPSSRSLFTGWHADGGYAGLKQLLSDDPSVTGVVCANDRVALGVLDAAKALGLRLPDDLSVVGYDNQLEIAGYSHPPLTTIHLPYFEMGRLAGQVLTGSTHGADAPVMVPCELVMRGSTATLR